MSETLTFGPEWLRALSSGNSVTSPPPSPGPKYKLAEHRYGKEEMLALFSEEVQLPKELELFESICRSRPTLPLAFVPLTEEEQRNSVGSVNSNAVLKLMGRGTTRGVNPVRGVGRGLRGRGRGDGGFIRQTSYEDTRGEGGGGFGRGTDTRRQGWNENSRGSFERSPSLRESGPSGPGRGGYDPSRPRLSSDTSWERPERRSDSGNWRAGGGGEDDDGWRVSGQRSSDRSERWRGGLTRGRASWRGGTDSYRERSHPDEEWQTARSNRRSYHDHEDVRWSSSNERLPEWSSNDGEDFQTPGTFDSSGAFVLQKQNEEKDENKDERKLEEEDEVWREDESSQPTESDCLKTATQDRSPKEHQEDDKVEDKSPDRGSTQTGVERRVAESSEAPSPISPSAKTPPSLNTSSTTSLPSAIVSSPPPSPSPSSNNSSNQQSCPPQEEVPRNPPTTVSEPSVRSPVSSEPCFPASPTHLANEDNIKKDEEPNMEHFAQAAENLVASLDDDEEGVVDQTVTQQKEYCSSPTTAEEVQWCYTDPQGKVQGPFSNSEMADWFSHGYFTMRLLVKRTTDDAFQPLGDIIKQWGRVPFIPGPQPPPFKGIPEHIQRQQQQMLAQQQYQHLMQQHYLQQQLFHQQALMMQQQQQQQQLQQTQQQMHQLQQPLRSSPQNTSPSNTQHTQPPQASQGGVHPMEPQPQPSRPQNLAGHAESIWGPTATAQVTPSIISPGPWSPVTTNGSGKGWDKEVSSQKSVPSFEEIQRLEEEKENQARLEAERREAKARALRLKQQQEEEERRGLHEAAMLQKQREEDERRQQEEAERQRKEQEELRKKQQEEARRKQEEEHRRKQEQEALRKQEQKRQQQLEQQKLQEEQKRMSELRQQQQQQQQQAMLRLKQQQQELLRKKEMQQRAEMQQRELQHKLQQKRQENQVSGGSLWGASQQVQAAMSLAQIQQQEERERQRRELQLQQLQQAQQQREQQARALPGWGERPPAANQPVKSLLQIQQEQARQQDKKKQQQGGALSRSQPSHNPLSSSVWGNSGPLSTSWGSGGTSSNIWGVSASQHSQQLYDEESDDDDDDDDDDSTGESFWDDAIKAASKSRQQQQQSLPQHRQQHSTAPSYPSLSANKMANKRTNREEEALRRLFRRQQTQADEFSQWCDQSLHKLKATGVDIPTFSAFLKDVESPYEVYDYVKSFLGDSRETREFAREFIERRKKQREAVATHIPSFPQATVWGMPPPSGAFPGKPTNAPHQLGPFGAGPVLDDPQDASNKKRRKKKMQKVDPSILGFSVNAADRVNIGEIQSVED